MGKISAVINIAIMSPYFQSIVNICAVLLSIVLILILMGFYAIMGVGCLGFLKG